MQKLIREYQDKSVKVLKASKEEFKKAKAMYNEEALASFENQIVKETEKKLRAIKNEFIMKGTKLVADKMGKAQAEENNFNIKDNAEFLRFYLETKLKYSIQPVHQIMQAMEDIENPLEFNVAKQVALSLADKEQTNQLYQMNWASPLAKDIKQDQLYIRELQMNNNSYVLPLSMSNIREYITGISSSDYYFRNNNLEDVSDMYFGGNR